jgi:major intracellular serine protease
MNRLYRLPLSSLTVITVVTALMVASVKPAAGAAAPHLDAIGYDAAQKDSRFSDLVADGGSGQAIAVFDSGIDAGHLMFEGRQVGGVNLGGGPIADQPDWGDPAGHGTAVASIAAGNGGTIEALDTTIGGVARQADLVSVRVSDESGSASYIDMMAGFDYVIDQVQNGGPHQNIEAINISLGTAQVYASAPTGSPVVERFNNQMRTLNEMGIPIIAAAGNSGSDQGLSFPAISQYAVSVGSVDASGALSSFSNRHEALDLVAPGESIWQAYQDDGSDSIVAQGSGTSFASPQVAGAMLLLDSLFEQEHGREPTVAELRDLVTTSDEMTADGTLGVPQLDLPSAFAATVESAPEPNALILMLCGVAVFSMRPRRSRQLQPSAS